MEPFAVLGIMYIIAVILIVAVCYLIGSIPTAYILVKVVKGIDIRTVGSGNVGATNAGRAIGGWAFWVVMVLDALKGFLPTFILLLYFGSTNNIVLFAATALILGHSFPIFLRFAGGKGVATGLGIFLALAPQAVLVAGLVFGALVLIFRMISLGSIVAALVLSAVVVVTSNWWELWVFTCAIAAFVIYKHRSNIRRILDGNENKVKLFKR